MIEIIGDFSIYGFLGPSGPQTEAGATDANRWFPKSPWFQLTIHSRNGFQHSAAKVIMSLRRKNKAEKRSGKVYRWLIFSVLGCFLAAGLSDIIRKARKQTKNSSTERVPCICFFAASFRLTSTATWILTLVVNPEWNSKGLCDCGAQPCPVTVCVCFCLPSLWSPLEPYKVGDLC